MAAYIYFHCDEAHCSSHTGVNIVLEFSVLMNDFIPKHWSVTTKAGAKPIVRCPECTKVADL